MTHTTIAVIGHVDHGKTSLVKALTGVETDTLKEEQARGLSIALGFASRAGPTGQLHFVDAPGHADFIRTTASGMTGADAALLVVSAKDGVAAQTREHLKLAHFFGIHHIVVALTKSDLITDAAKAKQLTAITELLDQFSFETPSITSCSSKSGDGMDALVKKLESIATLSQYHPRPAGIFLPIDRVFSAHGAGTIVTGTLIGGPLCQDASVCLEPSGRETTVRGLQIAGEETDSAESGTRVAANLRGIDAKSIRKGQVLCDLNLFQRSNRFDVSLEQSDGHTQSIKHMQHVMVLLGTGASPARIRLYSKTSDNEPNTNVLAQIEFQSPQIAYAGQRIAIRNPASAETLSGGVIVDPNARLVTRNKREHLSVLEAALAGDVRGIAAALAERDHGCVDLETLLRLSRSPKDSLAALLGERFKPNGTGLAFCCDTVDTLQARYVETLTDLHAARPCKPQISKEQIDAALRPSVPALVNWVENRLRAIGAIRSDEHGVALGTHDPLDLMNADQLAAYHAADQRLRETALRPAPVFDPATRTVEQTDLLDLLIWKQRAIRFYNHSLKQSFLLHSEIVEAAGKQLHQAFAGAGSFTTSEAREALTTNRKTIVPLLEYFDRAGATERNGNLREIVLNEAANETCAPASPN